MASYKLEILLTAQKEIRKLPQNVRLQVINTVKKLADSPRPIGCEKLKGSKSSYRIRVGVYRIVYSIKDKELVVQVLKVGHRKDVYRKR